MDKMTIQGTAIDLGSSTMVAIDTGTTLIGGPESIIKAFYAAIPGSSRMTGSYANYFQYPCATTINMQLTFGGYTINIADADFNLGRYSTDTTMCTGAVYVQSLSSSSPVQWIVGDTALKNVYSIYRYTPAAVGFAALPSSGSSSAAGSTTIPQVSALPVAVSTVANSSTNTASNASPSPSGGSASSKASGSGSSQSIAQASVVQVTAMSTVTAGSTTTGASGSAASSKSAGFRSYSLPRGLESTSPLAIILSMSLVTMTFSLVGMISS